MCDSFSAAVADRLELDEIVGEGEQRAAAGKELALEISAQAVTKDRDFEHIGDIGELLDLGASEELGFVDQHAGDRINRVLMAHAVEQIIGGREHLGRGLEADAGAHPAETGAGVDGGHEHQGAHATFLIIIARLQQNRRFAGIHRRVVKVELGHSGGGAVKSLT